MHALLVSSLFWIESASVYQLINQITRLSKACRSKLPPPCRLFGGRLIIDSNHIIIKTNLNHEVTT